MLGNFSLRSKGRCLLGTEPRLSKSQVSYLHSVKTRAIVKINCIWLQGRRSISSHSPPCTESRRETRCGQGQSSHSVRGPARQAPVPGVLLRLVPVSAINLPIPTRQLLSTSFTWLDLSPAQPSSPLGPDRGLVVTWLCDRQEARPALTPVSEQTLSQPSPDKDQTSGKFQEENP